jgi:hypothetical protein
MWCESGQVLPNGETTIREPYYWYENKELDLDSPAGATDPVARVAGVDRVDTAITASRDVFDDAHAANAVLATSGGFADSLAGAPLAAVFNGPLLLTAGDGLDGRVSSELRRALGPATADKTIALLGGTAALSPTVEQQVRDLGYSVVRIAGETRAGTAARIVDRWPYEIEQVYLVDGTEPYDGLIAGAAARASFPQSLGGAVVLLTNGSAMAAETADVLHDHPSATVVTVGPGAAAADASAVHITGDTPAARSVNLARYAYNTPVVFGVASAESFVDALAGGLHAAMKGGPLLYTDATAVPDVVDNYLAETHVSVDAGWVYGGSAAMSDAVVAEIQRRINSG